MALDPSIALQFKPLQIESPNALADYAMLAKLQEGQQAQQLNALKLEEARLGAQNRNRLRELDINAPDYIAQVTRIDPTLGLQLHKERAAAEESQAKTAAHRVSAAKDRQTMLGQAWRDISNRPSDSNINKYLEDIEASPLFTTEDKTSARRTAMSLLDMPFDQRGAAMAQYGAAAPTPPALLQEYKYAQNQGFKGTFFDFKRQIAEAGRTPAQPAAPVARDLRARSRKQHEGRRHP